MAVTVLAAVVVAGCRTVAPPDPARVAALAPELGELLLVGFEGTTGEGNAELERLLCETRVGGVLLFARNVVDADQVAALTRWIHERGRTCTGRGPLVAIDAEGGSVMRLSPVAGYAPTLSADELGQANDVTLTELEGRRIGALLRSAGVDWNLAPVVDVGLNPANPVIVGVGRSFSADPVMVTEHARAFVRGLRDGGVLTTLKHFPGHGSSFGDTHHGFVDVTDTANLDAELYPYRALIAERLADSIMTAHVFNRTLDRRDPATLSRPTIAGLLRGQLGYDGAVVSDDLRMGAIEQHYGLGDAARRAITAGVDVLLIAQDRLPDDRSAAAVALAALREALAGGCLPPGRLVDALARVRDLRTRAGLP